jgi:hypothetical protein
MTRYISSSKIADFSEIFAPDVELISISRSEVGEIGDMATNLIEPKRKLEVRWEQRTCSESTLLDSLAPRLHQDFLHAINAEIKLACEVLDMLLGCKRVGVRVATLRAPMCPRFHVDQVPCRMLITFTGRGTEWIASDEVDRSLFAERGNDKPPINATGSVKSMTAGSWNLLKGSTWDDKFFGVVHRSPLKTQDRLLLSLDPIFQDNSSGAKRQ